VNSAAIELIAELGFIFLGFTLLGGLAVLVHECGHAVAHLVFGHRVVWIRVGPLKFTPPRNLRWFWRWRELTSGKVFAQLRKPLGRGTAIQESVAVIAGPLANIGTALVLLPFCVGYGALSALCGWFAAVSGLVALAALMPYRAARFSSDGMKLLWLAFGKKRRDDLLFLLSVSFRLQEIRNLLEEKRCRKAFAQAEEFVEMYRQNSLAEVNSELLEKIAKLRDMIGAHRDCGETCKVAAAS
jgi:hypothetical protein